MDVTDQYFKYTTEYTALAIALSRTILRLAAHLNYANGGTIQNPEVDRCVVIFLIREINYRDEVGLFGSENYFVRVDVRLQNPIVGDYSVNDYKIAVASEEAVVPEDP